MRSLGTLALVALAACAGNSTGLGTTAAGTAASSTGEARTTAVSATSGAGGLTSTAGTTGATSTAVTATASSATSTGTGSSSGTEATTTTSGGANPYLDPDPGSLPLLTNPSDNPVLDPVSVVTVTFQDYLYTAQVQALGDYLAGSGYITTTLAEYGVGPMTNVNVPLSQAAPGPSTTDVDIQGWILENLPPFGSLPAPSAGFTPVYVIYYPSTTTITNEAGGVSCTDFSGYHLEEASDLLGSFSIYYAVIADCGNGTFDAQDLADVEWTAVHEIAEAATDPDDVDPTHDAWVDRDLSGAWDTTNYYITEAGDLCEGQTIVVDGGIAADGGPQTFTLTQLWSDDAALDGGAPCIPVDPNRPYYNVLVENTSLTAAVGSNATFNLTGWSSGPLSAWQLTAYPWESAVASTFMPTLAIGTSTLSNGETTTFTIGVPVGTASGAVAGAFLYSFLGDGTYSFVPVIVTAQ